MVKAVVIDFSKSDALEIIVREWYENGTLQFTNTLAEEDEHVGTGQRNGDIHPRQRARSKKLHGRNKRRNR